MNKTKYIIVFLTSIVSSSYAIQVLPTPQRPGSNWGKALGEGLSQGFKEGIAQKKRLQEQERLRQEEIDKIAHEKAILEDILKDYEPSKNAEYVLKILQSGLSHNTKELVINNLNEQYKLFHQKEKK